MKPIECRCGEISLKYVSTTPTKPYIETWECDCGHIACFHVGRKVAVITKGWGDSISQEIHCPECGELLEKQKQEEWWQAIDDDLDYQEECNAS